MEDDRFHRVIAPIRQAIEREYPNLWVEVVVPPHAVSKGTDWDRITSALVTGCIQVIPAILPDQHLREYNFADVPFAPSIRTERGGSLPGCCIGRFGPPRLAEELVENLIATLRAKRVQLSPYRASGLRTLLVLESIPCANSELFAASFRTAADLAGAEEFDEVYIAFSWRRAVRVLPLKLGVRLYPDLPEWRSFLMMQARLDDDAESR